MSQSIPKSGILVAAACLLSAASVYAQTNPPVKRVYFLEKPLPEKFHVFILAGQSNMAGRGELDYADRPLHPRVLEWNMRQGGWYEALDPFTRDMKSPYEAGGRFGISMAQEFLRLYADAHPDVMVGYVMLAAGGTSLQKNWVPDSKSIESLVRPLNAALPYGEVKGLLWHQGENDIYTGVITEGYEAKLIALMNWFRSRVKIPDLPIILGELPAFPSNTKSPASFKEFNEIIHRTADKIGRAAWVSADGLGHKGDELHINGASQIIFGKRYFEAYMKVVGAK